MELKKKLIIVILFLSEFMVFSNDYNWCDLLLKRNYTDKQLQYWIQQINEAKQTAQKKQISELKYSYKYNSMIFYEDFKNVSGKLSKGRDPSILYEIVVSQEFRVRIFVEKSGNITMQYLGNNQGILHLRYFDNKYHYYYYKGDEIIHKIVVPE